MDDDGRCPLQVGLHTPLQRNGASNLDVGRDVHLRHKIVGLLGGLLQNVHVLRLDEVRCVTIPVEASCDKAATHTATILTRNQNETQVSPLADSLCRDRAETVDDGHSEGCILDVFELSQQVVVECELGHVVDTVWEEIHKLVHLDEVRIPVVRSLRLG